MLCLVCCLCWQVSSLALCDICRLEKMLFSFSTTCCVGTLVDAIQRLNTLSAQSPKSLAAFCTGRLSDPVLIYFLPGVCILLVPLHLVGMSSSYYKAYGLLVMPDEYCLVSCACELLSLVGMEYRVQNHCVIHTQRKSWAVLFILPEILGLNI